MVPAGKEQKVTEGLAQCKLPKSSRISDERPAAFRPYSQTV